MSLFVNQLALDRADAARARVAGELATARKALLVLQAKVPTSGPLDHGVLSGTSRKPSPRADSRRFAGFDREAAAGVAADECAATVERLEDYLARLERTKPTGVSLEGLKAAVLVRDEFGAHRVVRVNKKTVTVATGYSWTVTMPFGKILGVR